MQVRSKLLDHSKMLDLFKFRHHRHNNFFSQMPLELIHRISGYDPEENWKDYLTSLRLASHGYSKALDSLLEAKPFLVLFKGGSFVTRTGRIVNIDEMTLLKCALGARNPRIAATIIPYFSIYEGGEAEKDKQFEQYRPFIEAAQKPDDLRSLFNILIKSTENDVTAELTHDTNYRSDLREAMISFRNDRKPGTMTEDGMQDNDQNLIHVFNMLDSELINLANIGNSKKFLLVWRQMIGYSELVGSSAYTRFALASGCVRKGSVDEADETMDYKHGNGSLPDFDASSECAHTGFGFDLAVDIDGLVSCGVQFASPGNNGLHLQNFCQATTASLLDLGRKNQPKPGI